MVAILLSDVVWEGLSTEMTDALPGLRDGHFFKQIDVGESYFRRAGVWENVNLGLAFIRATKSGRVTTDGNGDAQVVFNTPFSDVDYSVALSCVDISGPGAKFPLAYKYNRLPTGFRIVTRRTNGQVLGDIEVSWLATRDYNP
jgi:hypothetical protein